MDNPDTACGALGGILLSSVIWLIALFQFQQSRDEYWQNTAIENGAAEWRIDKKTGEKSFVWLTWPIDDGDFVDGNTK